MWEVKEEIEVSEYDDVGVNEDNFMVISELPESELAVVVFVVGVFFCSAVTDSFDESDGPTGSDQSLTFGVGDGVVDEN